MYKKTTVKYFQYYIKMESMAALKKKNKKKDLLKATQMFIFLAWQSCHIAIIYEKKNKRLNFISYE